MRFVISGEGVCDHWGSRRCERCFSEILEVEKEGVCILEQVDDGSEMTTLVVIEGDEERTFLLPPEHVGLMKGESWEQMMKGLKDFEVEG